MKSNFKSGNLLISIGVFLALLLATEVGANFIFPNYANDRNWKRMVFEKIINTPFDHAPPSKGFWGVPKVYT